MALKMFLARCFRSCRPAGGRAAEKLGIPYRPFVSLAAFALSLSAQTKVDAPTQIKNLSISGNGLTVAINGKALPQRPTLNFTFGTSFSGLTWTCADDPANNSTDCTPSVNTAAVLSHALDVQDVNHFCVDTSGTSSGACQTGEPFAWGGPNYQAGMSVDYVPGMTSTGSATLNVNNLGPMNVKLYDGTTDPGPRLVKGAVYHLVASASGSALVWRMTYGDSR